MMRIKIILGILALFNILAWIGVFQLNHSGLEVTFFDIGQGDAILTEWTQYIHSYSVETAFILS